MEKDFPDGIKVKNLRIGRLSWIIWAQSNYINLYKQNFLQLDLLLLDGATWKA